jgi:serine/threonine-protein kinase
MDFVAGRNLKEIMDEARRQGRFLEEKQVRAWAEQLCDALEYLHSQDPPILHRDVKPANIRLTPSTGSGHRPGGTLKLVDFGLVKLLAPDDSRTITILQGRGTIQYTPLEQYGGDTGHTDVRSDIYSLGATLYHLLTNHPPADVKQRFLKPDSLPSPRSLNPRLSPRIERAILRALEMHPDERPASVAEFRAELHSFAIPEPLTGLLPTEGEWIEATQDNRNLMAIALALLILTLLITLLAPSLPT